MVADAAVETPVDWISNTFARSKRPTPLSLKFFAMSANEFRNPLGFICIPKASTSEPRTILELNRSPDFLVSSCSRSRQMLYVCRDGTLFVQYCSPRAKLTWRQVYRILDSVWSLFQVSKVSYSCTLSPQKFVLYINSLRHGQANAL